MSFIYNDKNLILTLIKSGIDFENKYVRKNAQTLPLDPNADPSVKNYLLLTRKLVDQLEQNFYNKDKGQNVPAEISTELDVSSPLNVSSLSSFGNFLQYLEQNKILVNGNRVVYFGENPDPKSYLPVSGELDNMMETGKRESIKQEYFVNIKLLQDYLLSLQKLAQDTKDKVLEIMVGKRVEDVNKIFRMSLPKKYQEPEYVLSQEETLTTFPRTIDYSNYTADGSIQLLYKDIADANSFRSWAFSNKIQLKIPGYDKEFNVTDADFDFCNLIKVVYLKARWLLSRSISKDQERKYNIFVKQIEMVSKGISGPNGEACSLTSYEYDNKSKSTNKSKSPNVTDRSEVEKSDVDYNRAKIINSMKNMFPYKEGEIDFDRITRFVDKYSQIEPSISSFANTVKQQIKKAKSMLGEAATGQFLNEEVDDIQKKLEHPERIAEYLLTLQYIIETVAKIMMVFKSKDFDYMDDHTKDEFIKQVGSDANDASALRYNNALVIKNWQSNLHRVLRNN
jgi:hypothetical protein